MKSAPRWWLPELFLVVGIPALTVAGGLLTLALALKSGDLSDDDQHTGARGNSQMPTADMSPDFAAARAGLSAQLQLDRASGEVHVQFARPAPAPDGIVLDFVHSLREGKDLHARLQAHQGGWVAKLAPDAGARWRVVLADSDRRWRLVGTLPRGASTLSLRPAVISP